VLLSVSVRRDTSESFAIGSRMIACLIKGGGGAAAAAGNSAPTACVVTMRRFGDVVSPPSQLNSAVDAVGGEAPGHPYRSG
jgi:hypothetical protein